MLVLPPLYGFTSSCLPSRCPAGSPPGLPQARSFLMHPDDLHEVPVGVRSAARDDLGNVSLCRVWRVCFHEEVSCVLDGDGVLGHFARPFEAAILPRRAWLAAFSFSFNAGGGSGRSWRG